MFLSIFICYIIFFCYIMFFRHFQQCISQNAQKTTVTAGYSNSKNCCNRCLRLYIASFLTSGYSVTAIFL